MQEEVDWQVVERYELVKKLGSGAYGHVWKVKARSDGKHYALKKIFEAFQHGTDAQRTFREISIVSKLRHANIVGLHEVLPSTSGRDIYLVLEHMSTDLYRGIYDGLLQPVHHKYILYQMLLALHYLHSAGVMHRDLKPSNVLINQACQAKLCDFGLARHLVQQPVQTAVLTEGVATRWYRAPEVLLGCTHYDSKADMWSLGCILAEFVLKSPLFPGNSTAQQLDKILQFTGKPTPNDLDELDCPLAQSMVQQCSQVKTRTVREWLGACEGEYLDLVGSLLQFKASRRLCAEQALQHPYLREFFQPEDLKVFEGSIQMEASDDVKLTPRHYQALIQTYFLKPTPNTHLSQSPCKPPTRDPLRFSDLKKKHSREQSFGKLLENLPARISHDKDNKSRLFEGVIKHNTFASSRKQDKENLNANDREKDREKGRQKDNLREKDEDECKRLALSKHSTFAGLKKTSNLAGRFNK